MGDGSEGRAIINYILRFVCDFFLLFFIFCKSFLIFFSTSINRLLIKSYYLQPYIIFTFEAYNFVNNMIINMALKRTKS